MIKTLDIKALPAALVTLCLTVGVFFVADYFFQRDCVVGSYTEWGDRHLTDKMRGLDEHFKKYGRIDVIVFSSSVGESIDTGLWQRATSDTLICYNFSVPGMHAENVEAYFTKHIYPKYHPKTVLYIEHPRFVWDDGERDGLEPQRFITNFWRAPATRRMLAETFGEKLKSEIEMSSYLMQTKRYFRGSLQRGGELGGMESGPKTAIDEYGVTHNVSWDTVNQWPKFPVGRLQAHLSLNNLSRISEFCRQNKVNFFLVNQGQSSKAWAHYPPGAQELYPELLKSTTDPKNIIDAVGSLKLDAPDFINQYHLNAPGAERVSRYLFNFWLSPKLLGGLYGLGAEQMLAVAQTDTAVDETAEIVKMPYTPNAMQVALNTVGSSVTMGCVYEPGEYEVTVYSVHSKGNSSVPDERYEMRVFALDADSGMVRSDIVMPLSSRTNLSGNLNKTPCRLMFNRPARLRLAVLRLMDGKPLLLDSVSMRQVGIANDVAARQKGSRTEASVPTGADLLSNADFSILPKEGSTDVPALSWRCSSAKDAEVTVVAEGRTGLKLSTTGRQRSAPVVQTVDNALSASLCNRRIRLSFMAKSTPGTEVLGSLLLTEDGSTAPLRMTAKRRSGEPATEWALYTGEAVMPRRQFRRFEVELLLRSEADEPEVGLVDKLRLEVVE